MNTILFDYNIKSFLPLTFTRPIAELRVGIFTIKEKWNYYFNKISIKTEAYLSDKFPIKTIDNNLWINAQVLPNSAIVKEIKNLKDNQVLMKDDLPIAFLGEQYDYFSLHKKQIESNISVLKNIYDIFLQNESEIKEDFEIITQGRVSQELSESNHLLGDDQQIFIEKDAKVECAILNTNDGPIYIGKNAEIMEGSLIKGPFAMCEHSVVKMGAKIYGPTTLGPVCYVGGELNNVVITGYSNKVHDGFLGNSVIGEWCNIGADTNNSNLKNNYADVKLWSYTANQFLNTGLQFCGLIMGDHSRCGINTMFNTGTVIGVNTNIYGAGFPRNFIPSFSWGGASGFSTYKINKACEVAKKVMIRRGIDFDEKDKKILSHVFELTKVYRKD